MSSVVEPDKENKEQQTVSRKAVVCDSSAPRTPFADVNRQRCVRGDLGDGVFKPGQPTGKPSRTSDCLLQRQSHGICDSHFTPLRNRAKDTSLRPSLPIEKDIECSTAADQLLPVVSQSCPDMLMSIDLPLASIGEASAEKLAEACLFPGDLPALSPEHVSPCTSPDLSLVCEESTPLTVHNGSCRTESDADVSCGCAEDLEKVSYPETSQVVVSESLSYSVMSGEDDGSEAGSPRGESFVITCDSQEVVAWSPCPQADTKNESEAQSEESVDAARFVLEDVLKMVEETVTGSQQRDQKDSNPISVDLPTPHGQTFLSEYAHFVELYSQADSPTFANTTTGSLTDVTPISQDCEVQSSASSVSCSSAPCENPLVVVDSLSSFLSDSDESFSSTTTVQRHLTFEDGEMKSPETNLDDSFGFVRSSESRFDLREHVDQKGQTERGDSVERDFLNLSISEQKVEFIALPPRLKSVASSPIDPQSLNRSCSPVSGGTDATLKPALLQDAETMTVCAETTSTSVSPLVVPVCDRSTITVALPSPVSETTTPRRIAETNSIALSPMPVSVREQEANTSVTETLEVYTMTLAPPTTSEVALSPMAVARREVGTMTSVAATTEVGMGTEQTDCLDRSMLAAAEVDSKTTMTDSTGHRTVCTTMTPFKTMVKEGRRLTSDDIRKQHPRALANQMETLMVANSRMESQALQQKQEHKRLQGLVKEAKQLASSRQAELEAVDHQKREKWEEKEREQKERCQYLEQLSQEQQGRVASLEQELSALRAESEATALRQTEDLIALQERCRSLEGTHDQSEEQHRLEIEEMKKSEESDGYRHHFERAQQMVREREAELSEIRELFSDLQTTACKQEKIYSAYEQMHKKIITLASENRTLRDSIANRTGLSREEAEEEQREIAMLQQDKAYLEEELTGLKSTMTLHTDNLAELEKLYSASSVDVGIATGRLAELNSQLFAAEAAVQQAVVSKEALALQTQELEEQLCSMQGTENSLRLALHHTQAQLHQQALAHEKLQSMSQKMKRVYEDKLENMALGVENLQRTLDNREMDMNHLEKDLYECRNIIVEQRYKIDGLQSELREVKTVASAKKVEEEDIEFFKKSNSFLEAERSLYVESLRDLEERLQATSQERTQQQQVATVAQAMVEELQQEKLGLISELSHTQTQLANASKELSQAKEEQERVESVVMASANDLLQHMRLMLTELKKKIGLPEVPEAYPADNPQPPQVPHHLSSKPIKSRRHSRKSFVSSILGAITKVPGEGGNAAAEQDSDYWESGSYLGEAMTDSVRKAISAKRSRVVDMGSACKGSVVKRDVKEVTVMTMDLSFRDQGQENPDLHSAKQAAATISTGRRKLSFSNSHNQQPMSVSWTENLCQNTSGGTGPHRFYHVSSSLPGSPSHALLPPSLEPPPPPSSAVARVRSIPRTEYHRPLGGGFSWSGRDGGEEGIVGCVSSLKEVFSSISRLAGILNRATQLSLQDLREENDMLRERTEILEDRSERNNAELMVCREEVKAKDTAVLKLQQQCQEMTEQMMNFTDHRFQIRRLRDEVKRLESLVHQERCEKEVVSAELDHRLLGFDTSSSSAHGGGSSSAQARCVHDVIALKKKNLQLVMQLEEQREHYEEQGSKAARRMRVLDENWKKAEDELYRLDELVESVKQIAHRSSSPASDLQHILHLIEGETKSSPL